MKRVLLLTLLLYSGCGHPARVKVGEIKVTPPSNASAPSTVGSEKTSTTTDIPAGTIKRVIETGATPESPAKKETIYEFTKDSKEVSTETKQTATISNERAPDKSVEMFNAKAEEREPLLWVAIGLGVIGLGVAVVLKHPFIGLQIAGFGGGGAFASWKFAEVPGWIWGCGLLMAFFSWAFYTRGQWDKDGNGVPDAFQRKSP